MAVLQRPQCPLTRLCQPARSIAAADKAHSWCNWVRALSAILLISGVIRRCSLSLSSVPSNGVIGGPDRLRYSMH